MDWQQVWLGDPGKAAGTVENLGLPSATQATRLLRQTEGLQDEAVACITSAPPEKLQAQTGLLHKRQGWEIASVLDRRMANNLLMQWRWRAARRAAFLLPCPPCLA